MTDPRLARQANLTPDCSFAKSSSRAEPLPSLATLYSGTYDANSTVRYLGVDVEDALALAEGTEV